MQVDIHPALMRSPPQRAARAPDNDRHAAEPRSSRSRDTDRLIRDWHRQRSASERSDDPGGRGYDTRYDKTDLTHERASAEAAAALALARKYR